MLRRRTKGLLPVVLLILGVVLFGRGRSKPGDGPHNDGGMKAIPKAHAEEPQRHEAVRVAPAVDQPSVALPDKKQSVRVVGVHDGDTITVLTEGQEQIKVRLDAIDTPELGQPFGQASKKALSDLVFGKDVVVITKKKDRYGRTIGHVLVDGQDVNLLMLEQGMAWHYREYSKNTRLQQAEDSARSAKKGLWSDATPVPPWDWRKEHRGKGK